MQNDYEKILKFWFGELSGPEVFPDEKGKLWFNGGDEINRTVRETFGDMLPRAALGEFDSWAENPRGRLALIILLDQFPRNIFEDARAFAYDERALELVLEGLARGADRELFPVERWFFYMPLEHSEDLAMQKKCVGLFTKLAAEVPPSLELPVHIALDYAERHLRIIERFGRFPHRNETLGRESTVEELSFLQEPGSSF